MKNRFKNCNVDILHNSDLNPYEVDLQKATESYSAWSRCFKLTSKNNSNFRKGKCFHISNPVIILDMLKAKFKDDETLKELPFFYLLFGDNGFDIVAHFMIEREELV